MEGITRLWKWGRDFGIYQVFAEPELECYRWKIDDSALAIGTLMGRVEKASICLSSTHKVGYPLSLSRLQTSSINLIKIQCQCRLVLSGVASKIQVQTWQSETSAESHLVIQSDKVEIRMKVS